MKAFIIKLLRFFLVCIALAAVANVGFFLYRGRLTPKYVERFARAPDVIQVANLGSSHGRYGFCYDHAEDTAAVNFALDSQTVQYDRRILEQYIGRFTEGGVLYVPVSYRSLIRPLVEDRDFFSVNRRYYFFLQPRLIKAFSWKGWLAAKLPGLYLPNWLAKYWETDEFDEASLRFAGDIDVEADAVESVERHITKYKTEAGYVWREENIACVVDIIRMCKAHGVTPILLTTPFLREYNEHVPANFLVQQQATIAGICAAEDVEYLDFSRDARFVDRYDLFCDCDHLNRNGALEFTDLLMSGALPQT